jgi:hypothetical protein
MEYRHFLGPHDAQLCILLDGNPGQALVAYVEGVLRFCILWFDNTNLFGWKENCYPAVGATNCFIPR